MHEGLERAVRQAVGRAVDELAGIARFGHERRAVGDLVDTCLQLHGLGHVLRADHIQDRGRALHDVGAAATGVEDGVVDARVVGHMLAQKLHADVHELDRVQRAPAQLRRARRVGGDAVEGVLHLDAGVRAAGDDLVAVLTSDFRFDNIFSRIVVFLFLDAGSEGKCRKGCQNKQILFHNNWFYADQISG